MTLSEAELLRSELEEVRQLLAIVPEDSVIDRLSLEERREDIERALERVTIVTRPRALITFRGKPVVGTEGVFADFASLAVGRLSDAIAAFAASLTRPLGSRGNIPNRDEYRLLITGTALGSFGFELIEHQPLPERPVEYESPVAQAFERVRALMHASLGSDEELADAAEEVDARALSALHEFVATLAKHEAMCTFQFKDRSFSYTSMTDVEKSASRLSRDNIHEEEVKLLGTVEGVLPNSRQFEFRLDPSGEIIRGRIAPELEDVARMNRLGDRRTEIIVTKTWVGTGKPRYLLHAYRDLEADRSP